MASDEKSFSDLVKEAPVAAGGDTVTLVGTLGKSDDANKFVLRLHDGSAATFEIAAVRKHAVLGHSVGHPIVQIEIDRKHLTENVDRQLPGGKLGASDLPLQAAYRTIPFLDSHNSLPAIDYFTLAWYDHTGTPPSIDYLQTPPGGDLPGTIQETIGDPGRVGDPAFGAIAPFSLATPHQIAPQQAEQLFGSALGGTRTYLTAYLWTADHRYLPTVSW